MKKLLCCLFAFGLLVGCAAEENLPPVETPEENKQDLEITSPEEESFSYDIYEEVFEFKEASYVPKDSNVETIHFDSQELTDLNEKFQNEFEDFLLENQKNEEYDEWNVFYARNLDVYDLGDTLTIVVRDSIYANRVGGPPVDNYTCYHINKINHEIMTNTQFLEFYSYDLTDIQDKVNTLVENMSIVQEETDLTPLKHIYGSQINDDSCIFILDGNLNLIITKVVIGDGYVSECIEIK